MANQLKEEDINIVYYDFFNHLENDTVRQLCIASWKKHMPKANFICKTENTPEIAEFIKNDKWCQECIKNDMRNYLVDTIRLWDSLRTENYLYLDTDVYMFNNLMPLLNSHDMFASAQIDGLWDGYANEENYRVFQNGTIMWSRKPNEVIKELLEKYKTEECIRGHYNSYVNYHFQKEQNPKLQEYAIEEVNDYVYHLFKSAFEREAKIYSKRIAVKYEDFKNLNDMYKSLPLIVYNCPKSAFVYSFGSNKYRFNILYFGCECIPITEQRKLLENMFNVKYL